MCNLICRKDENNAYERRMIVHYTGTIWRPPYEAGSLLLETTAGCTHHKCKFCTLYNDLPFSFQMSPLEDIEEDLQEAAKRNRMWGWECRRVFLTGANPFVLKFANSSSNFYPLSVYSSMHRKTDCLSSFSGISFRAMPAVTFINLE